MSAYQEFTGKTVEEALRNAREAFSVGLDDLDFEILTPGSRGVLGMGAEPARIVAAPRGALGGTAPNREAAQATPLPPTRSDDQARDDRPPRRDDRPPRRDDRPPRPDRQRTDAGGPSEPAADRTATEPQQDQGSRADRPPRRDDRPPRREDRGDRPPRRDDRPRRAPSTDLTERDQAELLAARGSSSPERAELDVSDVSPEALQAGQEILEKLMELLDFDVRVEIQTGDTSRLNVVGADDEREALGALIGRKGERLSALQHLVNLMLSRRMGDWTRVLVDVEDYRGRRERQLVEIAKRASERVLETGKMLQLEPMSALERRWIHIALRDNPDVVTQSIGEEPNRRIVVLPRS
ncbi:MAG: spoIIIJ-associated protein [Chloroflexota bacterium]|nr:spoIIIJ-associated protein [Chloroflexota bacterium]